MVTILIPTTPERREQLARCLWSIVQNTQDIQHRILIYENNDGGWVKAVHNALEGIDGYVVLIGSDVVVCEGWLRKLWDEFIKAFPNGDGVASPYDEFHKGNLATHPLAHSKTLKKYINKEYVHCFSDNELTEQVKKRDKYIYVPEAKIEHHHYLNGKAENDETYKAVYNEEVFNKDRETFKRRQANGFPL